MVHIASYFDSCCTCSPPTRAQRTVRIRVPAGGDQPLQFTDVLAQVRSLMILLVQKSRIRKQVSPPAERVKLLLCKTAKQLLSKQLCKHPKIAFLSANTPECLPDCHE